MGKVNKWKLFICRCKRDITDKKLTFSNNLQTNEECCTWNSYQKPGVLALHDYYDRHNWLKVAKLERICGFLSQTQLLKQVAHFFHLLVQADAVQNYKQISLLNKNNWITSSHLCLLNVTVDIQRWPEQPVLGYPMMCWLFDNFGLQWLLKLIFWPGSPLQHFLHLLKEIPSVIHMEKIKFYKTHTEYVWETLCYCGSFYLRTLKVFLFYLLIVWQPFWSFFMILVCSS